MLSLLKVLSSVALFFGVCTESEPCPSVNAVDFDLTKVVGKWYEYAYTKYGYHGDQICKTHVWSYPKDGMSTVVSDSISQKTGRHMRIENEDYVNKTGNYLHVLSHVPLIGVQTSIFYALEAVYDSHLISWNCKTLGNKYEGTVGVYTRKKNPTIDVMKIAKKIAGRNGIPVGDLKKTDLKNCN